MTGQADLKQSGSLMRDLRLFGRLWPFIRKNRRLVWVVALCAPIGALCETFQPLLIREAFDQHIVLGELEGLGTLIARFALIVLGAYLFKSLALFALQRIGLYSLARIRRALFTHTLSQGQRFFDQQSSGALMTRTINDVEAIYDSLTRGMVGIITDALLIIGSLSVMLWMDWRMTCVAFSISPLIIFVVDRCRKQLRRLFAKLRELTSSLNGLFAEQINGMSTIQLNSGEALAKRRFDTISSDFMKTYHSANWWDAGLYAVMDGLSALSVGLIIGYAAWLLGAAEAEGVEAGLTVGLSVAFVDALNRIYVPIREFSGRVASLQRAATAVERIIQLLETHDEVSIGGADLPTPGPLTFDQVSFRYRDDGPLILNEVSFTLNPGEVVALVGATGSGKSTIGRLLLRAYDGYSGEITLSGVPLSSLSAEAAAEALVAVQQDPLLFNASIRENIKLWRDDLSEARIEEAAQRARVSAFSDQLPEGLESSCGQRGERLSIGQRQLVTIARVFARDAAIVLLDEATASVDALTEEWIDEATASLFKERTVLVIAHRLSTIRKADRILVLSEGRIIEEGSHEELLLREGTYHALVESSLHADHSGIHVGDVDD
ncbi:MAG: ABC transporter ATP-binding protein [Myxococcota bacterium]|nr:ABC transporter ATP-binding protein [Myxococcota bacterium]